MLPRPPNKLVPPMITEAMMWISSEVPSVAWVPSDAGDPQETAERHGEADEAVGRDLHEAHPHPGQPRRLPVASHGADVHAEGGDV